MCGCSGSAYFPSSRRCSCVFWGTCSSKCNIAISLWVESVKLKAYFWMYPRWYSLLTRSFINAIITSIVTATSAWTEEELEEWRGCFRARVHPARPTKVGPCQIISMVLHLQEWSAWNLSVYHLPVCHSCRKNTKVVFLLVCYDIFIDTSDFLACWKLIRTRVGGLWSFNHPVFWCYAFLWCKENVSESLWTLCIK